MARRNDAWQRRGASFLCMILEARRPERVPQLATNADLTFIRGERPMKIGLATARK